MDDEMIEALALDAAKLEAMGQPSCHVFHQGSEWSGFKPEQCVCGHMLEHPLHEVDLRPFGIYF